MNESQAAAKWLFAKLAANAGVTALVPSSRIFESVAPAEVTTYPQITFNQQAAERDRHASGLGAPRLMSRLVFQVRATAKGHRYSEADAVASAIDTALHNQQGTVEIGTVTYRVTCWRETPVRFAEGAAGAPGVQYRHSGALFRLMVTESS